MKWQIDYRHSPNGLIKLYNLTDWWNSTFSNEEKNHIIDAYSPIGMPRKSLVKGEFLDSGNSVISFLTNLSSWFNKAKDRYIAIEILKKAELLVDEKTPPLEYHFLLQHIIRVHYSNRREDTNSLNKALWACTEQIEFAPKAAIAFKNENNFSDLPIHVGYEEIVKVNEKEKKLQEAIFYCKKALEEGWRGNWTDKIDRFQKKMNNAGFKQEFFAFISSFY